jgi:hypothetical protein
MLTLARWRWRKRCPPSMWALPVKLTYHAQTAVVRVLGQKSRLWEITDAVPTCRS